MRFEGWFPQLKLRAIVECSCGTWFWLKLKPKPNGRSRTSASHDLAWPRTAWHEAQCVAQFVAPRRRSGVHGWGGRESDIGSRRVIPGQTGSNHFFDL